MRLGLALLALFVLAAGACSDPAAPPAPAAMTALSALEQSAPLGGLVAESPAVRVTTAAGQPVQGVSVVFSVQSGGGLIAGPETTTDGDGVARATSWSVGSAPGVNIVVAQSPRLAEKVEFRATALPEGCSALHVLDHAPGDFVRLKGAATPGIPCLLFDPHRAAQHEYLLLLESMPLTGVFDAGIFPGAPSGGGFGFTLNVAPLGAVAAAASTIPHADGPAAVHAWDFGAGSIRELRPELPPGQPGGARLRRSGQSLDLASSTVEPALGDTLELRMEGLPRLGIPTGNQKAVIRHVSPLLIIAEDVRLTTQLTREDGAFNAPLSADDLAAIAHEYDTNARVQGDLLFLGRHNTAVEDVAPHRVIAVHSLMPADDVWGYTYSSTNYFVWDFWVGTDGTTRGLNQHPQRVADNLFMHEIAHMRHWGLLQRAGSPPRGNQWLVEGFARFAERLPIAARLLGSTEFSRVENVVLPLNPAFGNAYFVDDVPTYGSASSGMFFGYQTSAFVFDYFADQVALRGGDWRAAVREFVAAGGAQTTLDAVVQRWLDVASFRDLFSRARMALYADDSGVTLPAWTQYHSYQLRQSRALPQQLQQQDPRNAWIRVHAGTAAAISGGVGAGAALGFVLHGADSTLPALFSVQAPSGSRVNVSLVRVR